MNKAIIPFKYTAELSLAGNAFGPVALSLASDSYFELHRIAGSCTEDADPDVMPNNFSVQIQDQSTGRLFSNLRVPQRILCSPANFNYRELRPVYFPPNASFQFDILNLTGNTNVVTLTFEGNKVREPGGSRGAGLFEGGPSSSLIPFVYISTLALASNQTSQVNLTMQTDAVFELHRVAGSSTLDLDTDFEPNNFAAQIEDLSSNEKFSNDLIPQRNFCSPANFNYREARPVQFSPGTILAYTLQNLVAEANTVTIGLQGYKFFGLVQ